MKKIYITGRKKATLVLRGKVKRNKITLRIYPVIGNVKSGTTANNNTYNKKNPLITLEFENVKAISNLIEALNLTRDAALRIEGYEIGKSEGYIKASLDNFIDTLDEIAPIVEE